jgi:protein O-GlcNAc transferase
LDQYEEAADAYSKALEWSPNRWEVLNNLAGCRLTQSRPRLAQALNRELIERNSTFQPARHNHCMATAYDDGESPADLAVVCTEAVQDLDTAPRPALSKTDGRPLKVGFVSADLRGHSVGAFVEPLFENVDPDTIEQLGSGLVKLTPKPDRSKLHHRHEV